MVRILATLAPSPASIYWTKAQACLSFDSESYEYVLLYVAQLHCYASIGMGDDVARTQTEYDHNQQCRISGTTRTWYAARSRSGLRVHLVSYLVSCVPQVLSIEKAFEEKSSKHLIPGTEYLIPQGINIPGTAVQNLVPGTLVCSVCLIVNRSARKTHLEVEIHYAKLATRVTS